MENFKVINDIKTYVEGLIRDGIVPFSAIKNGYITAEDVEPGYELTTYTEGEGGFVETVAVAKIDQVIVTKADENANPIRYKNGHINQWLMSKNTLESKYDNIQGNLYAPKAIKQTFIKISEAISFKAPWGKEEKININGYLNITDINEIYGIQEMDFLDTYGVL